MLLRLITNVMLKINKYDYTIGSGTVNGIDWRDRHGVVITTVKWRRPAGVLRAQLTGWLSLPEGDFFNFFSTFSN